MKSTSLLPILFILLIFNSCKKETPATLQEGFVKSFASDSDVAVIGTVQLDDGNFLIAGDDNTATWDQSIRSQGSLMKIDDKGNMIWKKRLSPLNTILWKVIAVPGTGFLTFGINDYNLNTLFVCIYDNDGNFMTSHTITAGQFNYYKAPYDITRLSNGNFVITGASVVLNGTGAIRIFDPSFNLLYIRTFTLPPSSSQTVCRGVCEEGDSNLVITLSTQEMFTQIIYTQLLLTKMDGTIISTTTVGDSVYSQTPNAVAAYANGLFTVSAKMKGYNTGSGTTVNYTNNYNGNGLPVSGTVTINRFTPIGQFAGSTQLNNYSGNGMINSLRKTTDGGYILCGTVNQLNTFLVVSETKIYLVKLDANLGVEWSKIINTTYRTIGVDALQTSDGGYLVSGFQHSLDKRYEALVIKTDSQGNIY